MVLLLSQQKRWRYKDVMGHVHRAEKGDKVVIELNGCTYTITTKHTGVGVHQLKITSSDPQLVVRSQYANQILVSAEQ